MIIRGGENISSREVEIALHKHPSISDCSVIWIHDDKWGEQVLGVVVLSENQKVTESELIDHCKKHLEKYKYPKGMIFVYSLPTDPMGKVQKSVFRELYGR